MVTPACVCVCVPQVETMHDFEAANSDELDLKRGDVVLVVPTASLEDQVRRAGDTRELLLSSNHISQEELMFYILHQIYMDSKSEDNN